MLDEELLLDESLADFCEWVPSLPPIWLLEPESGVALFDVPLADEPVPVEPDAPLPMAPEPDVLPPLLPDELPAPMLPEPVLPVPDEEPSPRWWRHWPNSSENFR